MNAGTRSAKLIRSDAEAVDAAKAVAALVRERASQRDQTAAHPYEELDRLAQSGLLGITVPREFGGADVAQETVAEVFRILARADGAFAQIPQNHFVFLDVIRHAGTPRQKRFFFAEVLAGSRFGNAQTERGGAHAKEVRTTLTPVSGGYRLDGRKFYCTGAISAQYVPVLARRGDEPPVVAFVDRDTPGLEIIDDWRAMGQRSTASGTATFAGVLVPEERIVPHWRIFERPQIWAAAANLTHVAIDLGIAQDAFEDTIAFIRNHARPWYEAGVDAAANDPLILHRIGQLCARLHAAEELARNAARGLDAIAGRIDAQNSRRASLAVSEAKAFVGDVAVLAASELFSLGGASSADRGHNFDRHWRNARTHTLHDPNRWRYQRVGDFVLNERLPPNSRGH